MGFSLEKFETLVYSRDLEGGMRELFSLLDGLEKNYGFLGPQFEARPLRYVLEQETNEHVLTRLAAAVTCLLSDRNLQIAPQYQQVILSMHRWLALIFAASPFHNADHIIRSYNVRKEQTETFELELANEDLLKFCLLYMPDSEIPLNLNAIWEFSPQLAASLGLVLISPRFLGSPTAHLKREQILPWLAEKITQINDIEALPMGVLHDLYMHCSYADRKDKHDIKRSINVLIHKKLQQLGISNREIVPTLPQSEGEEKPVMLVVLEWFGSSHSIYRTHSLTMESARRHFRVVGMAYENCVDETSRQVFDEFIPLRQGSIFEQLKQIQLTASQLNASVCYMPSVGMFPVTMWLACLRVAPLQVMGLGHPATTHATAIDYVVVEEDYVGSKQCFSEELLILPKDGMPYRPSIASQEVNYFFSRRKNPEIVRIAVCCSTMKINPQFLQTCLVIAQKTKVKIHFYFLVGQSQGLLHPYVERVVKMYLGDSATVYPNQAYAEYMNVVQSCDMFINPFPFGNTNGIIDTVSAGLVGVCKTGPEVHEHIDQGLFERMGFPDWMIARNIEDYIEGALRLIENHQERVSLSEKFAGPDAIEVIFKGRPEIFGDLLFQKLLDKILSNSRQDSGVCVNDNLFSVAPQASSLAPTAEEITQVDVQQMTSEPESIFQKLIKNKNASEI